MATAGAAPPMVSDPILQNLEVMQLFIDIDFGCVYPCIC
jgi:hypothetical protein